MMLRCCGYVLLTVKDIFGQLLDGWMDEHVLQRKLSDDVVEGFRGASRMVIPLGIVLRNALRKRELVRDKVVSLARVSGG